MRVEGLRIGNWVYNETINKEIQVCPMMISQTSQIDYNIKPILLTEKWLIRFGFEQVNRINYDRKSTSVWARFSFFIAIWDDGRLFYDWMGGNTEVKYVHQLQNIYWCLLNEELKL